jgi:hypothetical protein
MLALGAGPSLTADGADFLKNAIAPWDFPGIVCEGVPDEYTGKSMVHTHRQIVDITATATDRYTIVILAPMPGVAYLLAQPLVTDTGFTYSVKVYPDYGAFFGGPQTNTSMMANVQKYRVIGQTVRAQATSSVFNSAGRLTAVRLDNVGLSSVGSSAYPYVSGLATLDLNEMSSYPGAVTAHVNDGLTAWTVNAQPMWPFSDIWASELTLYKAEAGGANTALTDGSGPGLLSGWGCTTPMALIISGSSVATSVTLELTQTVEYIPTPGSLLSGQCKPSPEYDPIALSSYKQATRLLPAAVPRAKNDGFWDNFLRVVGGVAGAIGPVFGPKAALLGASISTITGGLRSLLTGYGRTR